MVEQPENILLIVIDSLRHDHVSCYGNGNITSPFLDSVAKSGIKFEKAYAPAPWTVPVHGSLFTGLLPSYHGSHRKTKVFKQPAEATLAGILSDSGYCSVGFSANPWISPEFDFDAGFDDFQSLTPSSLFPDEDTRPEDIKNQWSAQKVREIISWAIDGNPIKRIGNGIWEKFVCKEFENADQLNESILDWLDQSNDSKTFIFANYMDVHDPHYDPVLDFNKLRRTATAEQAEISTPWTQHKAVSKRISFQSEPNDPERAIQLYEQSIKHVDNKLQELFTGLDRQIDLDNTLTIILGDHGECMGEQEYWGHGTYLYDELIRVPLLIRPPEGSEVNSIAHEHPVSLLDLPSYICDVAGTTMPIDQEFETSSFYSDIPLFAECTGPRPDMDGAASQDGYRAVINDDWIYIRNKESEEIEFRKSVGKPQQENPPEDMKKQLEEFEEERWKESEYPQQKDNTKMSQETENRLEDLGYL